MKLRRSSLGWWLAALALGTAATLACMAACSAVPPGAGLGWWQQQQGQWRLWQEAAPLSFLFGFALLFTLLSALALPGCGPLALIAGSAFGGLAGTLVVGGASTLGALLAFLAARHWGRERVQRRLGHRLRLLDDAVDRHGPWALFWLRLVPLVPYPLLNPLLGLSRLSTRDFLWPSLAGLTVGSLPYAWAGQSLGTWLAEGRPDWGTLGATALVLLALTTAARRWAPAHVPRGPQ
ncbi:MAG: VTT domain-containing protein [Burkholderiaceae bacterium]|jgi:uncharacterized membrane protein YdjX (TVP38/TMEM64 family)|nr:VTT domain-containing protein [Burkholderiaceae bacterium]